MSNSPGHVYKLPRKFNMFNCELCGRPIEAGICELCIAELGMEVYQERVETAQDDFFAEWCVETDDSEIEEDMVEAITRGVLDAILAGRSAEEYAFDARKGASLGDTDGDIYPLVVGCLESTPCSVCGRWSTGLCCN